MDLIKKLAEEYIHRTEKPNNKYVIEPNEGLRCVIFKNGNLVKVLHNEIDISDKVPKLIDSVLNCINVDIILDGFLTDDNITFKELFETNTLQFKISDILYYTKNIKNLSWAERHVYIGKLNRFQNFKQTQTHIVTNPKEAKEVYDYFKSQKVNSLLIKDYNGKYTDTILSYM